MPAFQVDAAVAVRVQAEPLAAVTAAIFERVGVPPRDARTATDALVQADLRGVDSHGVSNMFRRYVEDFRQGSSNPAPNWTVVHETPATATVDGDNGLGVVITPRAMEVAIRKASATGVGMVTVQQSGHLGMAQYHAMLALPHDMIGICTTATPPLMVPTFGRDARLGTNPIAFAAPCGEEPPFVFDAATTVVAGNKLVNARRLGATIPGGLVAAEDGSPIVEPGPAPEDYHRLLPLGSTPETASHKGYGLACVVEILSNVLGGLTFAARARGYGHFVAAIDVAAFSPPADFKHTMDDFVRTLKQTPPAPGHERVLAPGQIEWETEQERRANGIPLHPEVVAWFDQTCAELNLGERLPRP